MNTRINRDCLTLEQRDLSSWTRIHPEMLKHPETYKKRERAIRMYFTGAPLEEICETCKLTRQQLYRLIHRCLADHPDGNIYGWRGLIKYGRQKGYVRTAPSPGFLPDRQAGASGALRQLFERFPDIEDGVKKLWLKEPVDGVIPEPLATATTILKWFHDACRRKGLTSKHYPFSMEGLGRIAIWRYLDGLEQKFPEEVARARYGKKLAKQLAPERSATSADAIEKPGQRVQFDGHRIDAFFALIIPHPFGGTIRRLLYRLWLLVIIDVASRAILGYHISLNREYNSHDVLLCVRNAITPWKPRKLTIPGLEYPARGGLPCGILAPAAWALWDEFSYDNAKANLAKRCLKKITDVVGCGINPGPVENPELRGILERLFQTLEANGYHRLPSTTGSSPQDPRRDDPEKVAVDLEIALEHLYDLSDVLMAQYNTTPQQALGYKSPMDVLEFFFNDDRNIIRHVPEDQRGKLGLLDIEDVRTISGRGRRPYVDYCNARYESELLARSRHLVKQKVRLVIDPDDPRSIRAYLAGGNELGVLTAKGIWGKRPHSLDIRKTIFKLKKKRLIYVSQNQDPMRVYLEYLTAQKNNKHIAGKIAQSQPYFDPQILDSFAQVEESAAAEHEDSQTPLIIPDSAIVRRSFTF